MNTVRAYVLIQAKGGQRDAIIAALTDNNAPIEGIGTIVRTQGVYDLHVVVERHTEREFIETVDMIKMISAIDHLVVDRVIHRKVDSAGDDSDNQS